MMISHEDFYYPIYVDVDVRDIRKILDKSPDTIRGWTSGSGLILASGFGHTHDSIRKMAKGLDCEVDFIIGKKSEMRWEGCVNDFVCAGIAT